MLRRLLAVLAILAALAIHPAASGALAAELCDGRDDDGDGTIDAGCPTVCGDPRVLASEGAASDAAARTTLGRDRVLAWDGHGFGAVWSQAAGLDTEIVFRRLDPSGGPAGDPLPLSARTAAELDPVVAWSGNGYGVAWSEEDFGLPRILFAFVDARGRLAAGPVGVNVAGQDGQRPAIAWDGDAFVVAWAWYNGRVHTRRVREDGTFATAAACLTCGAPNGADEVSLAVAPAAIGVTWSDGAGTIRFVRSDRAGQPVGLPAAVHSGHAATQPAIAWNGGEWAVVWGDRRSGGPGIYAARVSSAGAPVGVDQRLDGAEAYANHASLAWTGSEYVAGWVGGASGAYGLRLRRLDAAAVPLGAVLPVPVPPQPAFPDFRAGLAWTGSRPAFLRDEVPSAAARPARIRLVDCCEDADGDGVNACAGDADDGDPQVFPGASERCNGRDDDLDGTLDEGCDRECAGAPLTPFESRGAQADAGLGLASSSEPGLAWLARVDGAASADPLVLESGGPPWTTSPLEADPAASLEPAVAWTGRRAAVVFRDARDGVPALRYAARAADGAPFVSDAPLVPAEAGTASPSLAWNGRRLAVGWAAGSPPSARLSVFTETGSRLVDEIRLGEAGGPLPPRGGSIVVAPDPQGGTVVLWVDPQAAVFVEWRDAHGGRRGAPVLVAAASPAEDRRARAVVMAGDTAIAAWDAVLAGGDPAHASGVRAAVRRDGTVTRAPAPFGCAGRGAALAYTGVEVVAVCHDADAGLLRQRLDPAGDVIGAETPLAEPGSEAARAAWDGGAVRLAWTRVLAGGTRDVRTARLDCAAAPVASPVRHALVERAAGSPGATQLRWSPVELAVYDVVSGDLARLRAGAGDFATAVDVCEASRVATTSVPLSDRPAPRFSLVRAVVGGAPGTWDDGGPGLAAPRDASVDASPAACP